MRVTADTNVLVRVFVKDDARQNRAALKLLESADIVAVSLQSLCEFCWVLERSYGTSKTDVATAIRALLNTANLVVNRPAVEAGLGMLDARGDFADGVIAHDGKWLGGETFFSFDKKAVALLAKQGQDARLLS